MALPPPRGNHCDFMSDMPRGCYAYLVATSRQSLEPVKYVSREFRLQLDKRESKMSNNAHPACIPNVGNANGGGLSFLAFLAGCANSRRPDGTEGRHSTVYFTWTKEMFSDRQRYPKTCLLETDGGWFWEFPTSSHCRTPRTGVIARDCHALNEG